MSWRPNVKGRACSAVDSLCVFNRRGAEGDSIENGGKGASSSSSAAQVSFAFTLVQGNSDQARLRRVNAQLATAPAHFHRSSAVSTHPARPSRGPVLVVAGAVTYFVLLASLWPTRPGLYMDETNFVNASVGGFSHESFVYSRIGGVPTMIMPYIGALKSWLFAPVFFVFGVSPLSIRLPAIVLSAITIVLAYWALRSVVGRWPSAVLAVIMGTAPTFAFMSKVDWGPIVLAMLLKVAALGAFFRLLETGRVRWLVVMLALIFLGIFNKQDFLWITVGILAGALVAYAPRCWAILRSQSGAVSSVLGVFVAACVAYGWTVIRPNLRTGGSSQLQNPLSHLGSTWHLYQLTTTYSAVVGFFSGRMPAQPGWLEVVWPLTAACLLLLVLRRFRGPLPDAAVGPAPPRLSSSPS